MKEIKLSYVLTTFNKLPYLKKVITRLIQHVKEDEEIIITDGGSTDGTKEYLAELLDQHFIHQYVSERDGGEAHGFNKGLLMANGQLIKCLTDDDSFYFPSIELCKKYMLEHPETDVLISKVGTTFINDYANIELHDNYHLKMNYLLRKKKMHISCGIPILLTKRSLSKLGLFNPTCKLIDNEFMLRISTLSNTVFYTNPLAVRIENPKSNLVSLSYDQWYSENLRVGFMYGAIPLKELAGYTTIELTNELLRRVRFKLSHLVNSYGNSKGVKRNFTIDDLKRIPANDSKDLTPFLDNLFDNAESWLQENNKVNGEFISAASIEAL